MVDVQNNDEDYLLYDETVKTTQKQNNNNIKIG